MSRHLRRQQRLGRLQRVHLFTPIDNERLLAAHGRVGDDGQRDVEAAFEIAQMSALVVEDVERDVSAGAHHEVVGGAFHQYFLEPAQQLQGHRRHGSYVTAAAALRTGLGRAFEHAGTNSLARHFQQAKMRNAPDLNPRAVLSQAIAQLTFHRAVVALLVHIDEVDDDQPSEVAQPKLPCHFLRGLEISL